jgi:TPR repeat protein
MGNSLSPLEAALRVLYHEPRNGVQRARARLERLVRCGHPDGAAGLAYCRVFGFGEPRDAASGVAALRELAGAGSAGAMALYGMCLLHRVGGDAASRGESRRARRSRQEALRWLKRARELGCDLGEYMVTKLELDSARADTDSESEDAAEAAEHCKQQVEAQKSAGL